jgi:hypothetical protein
MAFQKIDRLFVLSDSTVNVYGFRLLTSGCDLEESLRNPIGYYDHKKDDGVLVKWEEVALVDDQIVGKPVINLEHPRAARTITEINEDFLNAASVGHICLLETALEDNPDNEDEPILVGLKWYYKECSLVDSPGNRSAFKLYDQQEKEINLADARLSLIDKSVLKPKNNMSKIALTISPLLVSLLNLSDSTDQGAFEDAVQNLHDEKKGAEKKLADTLKKHNGEKIASILDKGLADGKYNKATRDKLAKTYADKPDELSDLVNDMTAYKPLTDTLVDGDIPKDLADKSYDDLHRAGKIKELKTKFPARYKVVYKEKFGEEPKA